MKLDFHRAILVIAILALDDVVGQIDDVYLSVRREREPEAI